MQMQPSKEISRLIEIMAALRTPATGCPWDIEQDFSSIAPYTIEEAYEVADAIERQDMGDLCEELGDLLLQVVFHARMAEENGQFWFGDVVEAVTEKMIRRHPHVFGDKNARGAGMAKGMWEKIKAQEKAQRRARRRDKGLTEEEQRYLDEVPAALPALTRALKLQQKAACVDFDWRDAGLVLDKIEEEIGELRQAIANGHQDEMQDELGDLLFTVTNLGRHLQIDSEQALAAANRKFLRRFSHIEDCLKARGETLKEASLEQMEALWKRSKSLPGDHENEC